MLSALDHVSLAVGDLDAATRRMVALLGRAPTWHGQRPTDGAMSTFFALENTHLELRAAAGDGPEAGALRARLERAGEGLWGLAFATTDLEACRADLERRGLAPGPLESGIDRDTESGAFRRWRRVAIPPERSRGVRLEVVEAPAADAVLSPSASLGDERASVFALDHAVVRTTDGDAAAAVYGEGLGLRLALDREFPQWGARLLFFRVGGLTIEVAASLEASAEPPEADSLWGLSWRVRDADAARARLAAQGLDVSEVRAGRKPGTRVLSVRDGTCGVPTLLLEPAARPAT